MLDGCLLHEGQLRRHEASTDMGYFLFLVSRECWRGKGMWGNIKISTEGLGCVICLLNIHLPLPYVNF